MANSSVQNPPQPAIVPALPAGPSRPQTRLWPTATLPPALHAGTATETPPPLRRNDPAAAVTGQRKRKRGAPPLPPSVNGAKKPKTAQLHTPPPPASSSSVVVAAATTTAERRLALDRKVAGFLLTRSWAGPAAAWRRQAEGRAAALRCLCPELPRGSRCALHQESPWRSWMEQRRNGGVPLVGGDGEVLVPTVRAGDDAEVFAEYARWRRSVRMPSRFYVQHVRQAIDVGQDCPV